MPQVSSRMSPPCFRSDFGCDTMELSNDDSAFILGKGGKTKEKLARVSGCKLNLCDDRDSRERRSVLEIRGPAENRRKARKYINCVMDQPQQPPACPGPSLLGRFSLTAVMGLP
eukprot:gene2850-3446_t